MARSNSKKIIISIILAFLLFLPISFSFPFQLLNTFGNGASSVTVQLISTRFNDNNFISLPVGIKVIYAGMEVKNLGDNATISVNVGEDNTLNFHQTLASGESSFFEFASDIQNYVKNIVSCNCPGCRLTVNNNKAYCDIPINVSSDNPTIVSLRNLKIEYIIVDSDQDSVPDNLDKCPNTPVEINTINPSQSSCTVFNNAINPETGCPNEPVKFNILNPEGYIGGTLDVAKNCSCISADECKLINVQFFINNLNATPNEGCNAYYGTPTWEGDCELDVPNGLSGNQRYTIYVDFYFDGIHYHYPIATNYLIKSPPANGKLTNVGYCTHGWYRHLPIITTDLSSSCRLKNGVYYCKPFTFSISHISSVILTCSNGATRSVEVPLITWVYKNSNLISEKDTNGYIPARFLTSYGRQDLFNLNKGLIFKLNPGTSLNDIYHFSSTDAGKVLDIYVDYQKAFCDSPFYYICPTTAEWCNIGDMTGNWQGFANVAHYKVEIIDPKAKLMQAPMGYTREHPAMLMPNQNSIAFEYVVKNTGYGDIKVTATPDCSPEIKDYCSVTPSTLILSSGQTGIIIVKLNKPKPSVKVKNKIQEVGVTIKYTDAYGLYTSAEGYPKTLIDPVPVFVDTQPPTTTITPDGNAWTNLDVNYKLTCDDIYPSGFYTGCNATYYYVGTDVDTASYSGTINTLTCPSDLSAYSVNFYPAPVGIGYTYGKVTCPAGHVCEKQVCFFSEDAAGNIETTKKSKIFYIDKQKPFIYTNLMTQKTLLSGSVFPVVISCNDGLGSGCKKTTLNLYYAGLTFTCNLNGNGKNTCDFTIPDNTGCYYASATYDLKGIDNVGNTNETIGVVWIKKRSGCPCTSNQECFSGECVNGYCVGSDNVSNAGITSAVKGSFIGIPTSYLKIKMDLGEKLQIPLTIQNPNDLPDTIKITINAKKPWAYWIYFSNKKFSSNPRELEVYLLPHQKTSVPIIILGNQLTNGPINISITAKSLTYNVRSQTINLELTVVQNKAGVSSSKSAPGLEWYMLPILALISSLIFVKLEW